MDASDDPSNAEVLALLKAGDADTLVERFLWLERLRAGLRVGVFGEGIVLGKFSDVAVRDAATIDHILKTAERPLRRMTEALPHTLEGHRALGRNLWYQGRHEESLRAFADGDAAAKQLAEASALKSEVFVLLPRDCVTAIGCMGHLDAFLKRKILTGDARPYVLLAPQDKIVNREFLDYWAPFVLIVTDPQEIAAMSAVEPALGVNWNWVLPTPSGDGVEYVHRGIARIQRRWYDESRSPLLRLRPEHAALLAEQKRAWGMAESDWFICLHVRSAGYYNEQPGTGDSFRNTPIEDYVPMIRDVVAAGGWVVRMGDPSMLPLDVGDVAFKGRVVDYARSPERSPVLDVALCASCRVFVAAPSGLSTVAKAFGRPACLVNFPIYAGLPWHPDDVFTPRRYYSRDKGRVLSFEEILSSDLVYADHGFLQEKAGVELLRNTPDEIVEAVREALDPAQYRTHDMDCGKAVRDEFERLNQIHDTQVAARLGLHFAAAHAAELMGEHKVGRTSETAGERPLYEAGV